MFEWGSVSFETISAWFKRARSYLFCYGIRLWRHWIDRDGDVIADVDNGWRECIAPIESDIYAWNIRIDSRLML